MHRKTLLIGAAFFSMAIALPIPAYSESPDSIPASIRSPQELCRWLSREFTYELKFPDHKQSTEETLRYRRGDCEDFAALSKIVLERIGIQSEILVIKFRDLGVFHAICIFRAGETYNFISNKDLVYTKGRTITDAINEKFPDWERIMVAGTGGGYSDIIERRFASIGTRSIAYNLAVPSYFNAMLGPDFRDLGAIKVLLQHQLMLLNDSGLPVNAGTFITILKDQKARGRRTAQIPEIAFVFEGIELAMDGFSITCLARDKVSTRRYRAVFTLHKDERGGFSVCVYTEEEWRNAGRSADMSSPRKVEGQTLQGDSRDHGSASRLATSITGNSNPSLH